jgi:hypothetical protein
MASAVRYPVSERTVRFDPTDAEFRGLVAELVNTPGIYWYECGGIVLKVGQSGRQGGAGSGVGNRLKHHVTVAYNDQASHRKDFPAWHAFMSALLNRRINVRWMECPPEELGEVEQEAIRDSPGGVLWETLKQERLALKRDPSQHPAFTKAIAAIIEPGASRR